MKQTILDVWKNGKGYIVLTLENEAGETKLDYLHRYMWKIYHPNREIPRGWDIHHYDGDYYNISKENLWCIPRGLHNLLEKNRRKLKRTIQSRLVFLLHPPKSASILMDVCERMENQYNPRENYIRGW